MHLPAVDPKLAFLVLIFAAMFAAGQAIYGLVRLNSAKRVVNRRLATAESTKSLGELVLELRKQRGLKENGQGRGGYLADLIVRSGVKYNPKKWSLYLLVIGFTVGLFGYSFTHNALVGLGAGLASGLVTPFIYLKIQAKGRAKMLGLQLPQALEVVVRSLEAGHPVPTAIALVGREMPDPIGTEFGMAGDEIAYGATLEQAVGNVAERCKHPDFDLFAATIRLQERAGGNLVGLLKMNAHTIRERQKMRMKIQAASSEGRASAMILTAAPLVIFGFLESVRPEFYGSVIHERVIQLWLGGFVLWMLLGNLIMRRMIDMRI